MEQRKRVYIGDEQEGVVFNIGVWKERRIRVVKKGNTIRGKKLWQDFSDINIQNLNFLDVVHFDFVKSI